MIKKYFKVFILFFHLSISAFASNEPVVNKAVEAYNNKQYEEAIEILNAGKSFKDRDIRWYYYYGLSLLRLERNEEALQYFNTYIEKNDITESARALYFIGLLNFYKGDYEKAINHFQAALDVSTERNLDRLLDIQIEKAIRYRDYYSRHKPGNFYMYLGYAYESNAINFSQKLSNTDLSGHVLNYGLNLSYRVVDKVNFVFYPNISVLDKYTLNSKLKAESATQATDLLQAMFSLPFAFYLGKDNTSIQYNLSLNAYTSYLPITTAKRDLYISSVFAKARVLADINKNVSLQSSLTYSSDKSDNFIASANDATGSRTDLDFNIKSFVNSEKTESVEVIFGVSNKTAKGNDARYQKVSTAIAYKFPSFSDTSSSATLNYSYMNFPDRSLARRDNKVVFDYLIIHPLNKSSSLNYLIGSETNSSNVEIYSYTDLRAGITYALNLGF